MLNHSSIVAGARSSGAKVAIFQHNCTLINAKCPYIYQFYYFIYLFIYLFIRNLQKALKKEEEFSFKIFKNKMMGGLQHHLIWSKCCANL